MTLFDRFRRRAPVESAPGSPATPDQAETLVIQADRPIETRAEDRFDRAPFAGQIANIIARRSDPSSLVIGLYGPWGDGKTSTLALIREALADHADIVAMDYNPWFYGASTEAITRSFFQSMSEALVRTGWFTKEKIGDLMSRLGKAIPHVGDAVSSLGEAMTTESLTETRDKVGRILRSHGKKLVVFVDDIDRLDRAEIQTLFKLVRLSGGFDHTTYVLAFDDVIVSEALGEAYGAGDSRAGRRFLEKIVQVPLHLPPASPEILRKMLFAACDRVVRDNEVTLGEAESYELGNALAAGFSSVLETPRQVKLFDNAITFAAPLLKGEVRFVDQVLLEGLRVFYPTVYQAVRDNPESVLRARDRHGQENAAETPVALAVADLPLNATGQARVSDLVEGLFPRLGQMGYDEGWDAIWAREKRVCSKDYFQRYFTYGVPAGDLSDLARDELIASAARGDQDGVAAVLDRAIDRGALPLLIRKLRLDEAKIPSAAAPLLIEGIAVRSDRIPLTREMFSGDWAFTQTAVLTAHLLQGLDVGAQDRLLESVADRAAFLPWVAEVVRFTRTYTDERGRAHGFVSDERLRGVVDRLLPRLIEVGDRGELFSAFGDRLTRVLFCIEMRGGPDVVEALKVYLGQVLARDPANAVRFIRSVTGTAWGMENGIPSVSDFDRSAYDSLKDLVDPDALYGQLRTIHGPALDEAVYERGDQSDVDRRLAMQFSALHRAPTDATLVEAEGEPDD